MLVALASVHLFAKTAIAQDAAYTFANAPVSSQGFISLGFLFTTNQDITVTSLGYYDDSQTGFATAHAVGIFDQDGTLLVSTRMEAGDGDALDGKFRYKDIDPITLAAGGTYTAAATTGGPADPFAYGHTVEIGLDVNPAIAIDEGGARYLYQSVDELAFPDGSAFGFTIYAGPNFKALTTP